MLTPHGCQNTNSVLKLQYSVFFQLVAPKEGDDFLKDSAVLTHKDGFSWNWNVVRAVLKVILK
jgi:hypothetical protein